MHDNSESNSGYVRFLNAVAETAISYTPENGSILDFGCGKNAVLAGILSKKGVRCDSYDPLFNYSIDFSDKHYDTIILCEVIEHIRNLHEDLSLIQKLTKQDSKVIIRTQRYPSLESFPQWWYRQDSTHLNFFSDKALEYIAALMNRVCVETLYKDIVVLTPAPNQG
jgi:2-polyprenyl-3-methyl-5-hydroxy-6-metoxy-1,4-benzoquinol methylase